MIEQCVGESKDHYQDRLRKKGYVIASSGCIVRGDDDGE